MKEDKLPPHKMAKMDALMKLKEAIDELMDDNFKTNKMPKLVKVEVKKLDAQPIDDVKELQEDSVVDEMSEQLEDSAEQPEEVVEMPEVSEETEEVVAEPELVEEDEDLKKLKSLMKK